jgi:hypothetical protein
LDARHQTAGQRTASFLHAVLFIKPQDVELSAWHTYDADDAVIAGF